MSDVKCPYCQHEQEINHDDGYGYGDGEEYQQWCSSCDREFSFVTSVSYSYEVYCKDESDHNLEPFGDEWPDMYQCSKCDYYTRIKDSTNE